ncbi:MAG: hypothetical protein IJ087_04350 [Eggerthellaceae bacterium]|nr:hypothetical protein [Eggerthellaceae bacterium]
MEGGAPRNNGSWNRRVRNEGGHARKSRWRGGAYTAFDHAENLDNTLSACGFDASLSVAFNRLVDPAHIISIEVGVTDVQGMDGLHDLAEADWPARTVTYSRS